jgi:hypothetical protein
VQPRSQGRCAAALPPPCAGLPGDVPTPHWRGNALEPPLRSARAADACHPATPSRGLCGSPTVPAGSAAAPLLSRVLCGLASLLVSVWNVLPQGSCVKAWPRGAHRQNGHCGLTAPEARRVYQAGCDAGGPWSAGPGRARRGTGGGRWTVWWQRAPTPLVRRCAPRVGQAVLHWPGCVPRIGTLWKASHGRGGVGGGQISGAAPLACGWPLRFSCLEATQGTRRSLLRQGPRCALPSSAGSPP